MRIRLGVSFRSFVVLWVAWHCGVADAQTTLDRIYPPVASVGKETSITAEGKFPNWPVGVVCDREDVHWVAGEKQGTFSVRVDDDAPAGVAWLRLYDEQSASALVPLLIAPIEVTLETEPNNRIGEATDVSMPAVLAGRLAKSGDSDAFRVSATAGKTLVVSATANQLLQSPMDAVLQISDLKGNVLVHSDDQRGLDPQITFDPPASQDYLVRIFCFPATPNSTINYAGSAAYVYSLEITQGPFVDHIAAVDAESAPFGFNLTGSESVAFADGTGVSPPTGTVPGALGWDWLEPIGDAKPTLIGDQSVSLTLPATVFGHFSKPGERHRLTLPVEKGVKYRAEVRSKTWGYLVDSELKILDAESGDELARNDDVKRGSYDAGVEFTAKEDGSVQVRVRDILDGAGPRHFYRLTIRRANPVYALTLAADRFAIREGETLEIPVSIDRKFGFSGRIRISAVGLPDGISAEPAISEAKGDSSKSVKLKLVATQVATGHTEFKISGQEIDAEGSGSGDERNATFSLRPEIDVSSFWLTMKPGETKSSATKPGKED